MDMTKKMETNDIWGMIWKHWARQGLASWDYMCESLYRIIIGQIKEFHGKLWLETGSGSGRVSLRLAEGGAQSVLFDVSREAIKFSKKLASYKKIDAHFIIGSIFALPFRVSSLHVVWNAGVLEHFKHGEQQLAISEALRVLRSGGKLTVIVPHRKAYFYNMSRIAAMKMKTWPFGFEEPLTCKEFEKFAPKPLKLQASGFMFQFICIYIPVVSTIMIRVIKILLRIFPLLKRLDQNAPGYFLTATFVKWN